MNRAARRKQQREIDKVRLSLAQGVSRYEALKMFEIERKRRTLRYRLAQLGQRALAYLNQRVA